MGYATVPTIVQVTASADRWVAIYARISKDRSGRAENVATQIKLAREYAQVRWAGVRVEVYCDNDLSAADPDTFRPEYHRLLGDIAAGHVCQIVSADHERLIRQIIEGEALIPLLRAAGIDGTYGYRDGFSSVRPGETTVTRFKHVMGAEYVEGLKVKLHEKLAANAGKGIPHGGKVYGYGRGLLPNGDKTLVIDETEAGWLRWMADQVVIEDRPVNHVADDLNDRDVATGFVWALGTKKRERERRDAGLEPEPRVPARWSSGSVIGVLTNVTVAGRRQYRGEDVGRGNWEPVLDMETHRMLRAKLIRTRTSPRAAIRKYVLSGIVYCAECSTKMTGQATDRRQEAVRCQYRCRGCFKANINGDALDAHIKAKLLERLDDLVELRRSDDTSAARRKAIYDELGELVERRALIGDMVATGDMDRVAAVRGKAKLDEVQQALSQELATLPIIEELPDPDAVRHAWDHLAVDERRHLIADYIDRIEVTKPKTTARRIDLSRVTIHGPGWEGDQAPPPPGAVAAAWRTTPADLSDDEWELVAELVKPPRRAERGRGNLKRQPLKHSLRCIVDAALYRETTGCWWRDLPDRYPPHRTVARYYQEWVDAGIWQNLCARLQAHTTGEDIPPATTAAQSWRAEPSDVTDDEWELVKELVAPPGRGRHGKRGRPFKHDLRQVLNAVLHREATGCVWHDLPEQYPPHRSVDRFYHDWLRTGTWATIRDRLQEHAPGADAA